MYKAGLVYLLWIIEQAPFQLNALLCLAKGLNVTQQYFQEAMIDWLQEVVWSAINILITLSTVINCVSKETLIFNQHIPSKMITSTHRLLWPTNMNL